MVREDRWSEVYDKSKILIKWRFQSSVNRQDDGSAKDCTSQDARCLQCLKRSCYGCPNYQEESAPESFWAKQEKTFRNPGMQNYIYRNLEPCWADEPKRVPLGSYTAQTCTSPAISFASKPERNSRIDDRGATAPHGSGQASETNRCPPIPEAFKAVRGEQTGVQVVLEKEKESGCCLVM
ncbi:hypothetical protein J1614_006980 [Plenodomus biglobosus]|nr:hypothetical protein J1614_006980 [Plenodomus biglobosus]